MNIDRMAGRTQILLAVGRHIARWRAAVAHTILGMNSGRPEDATVRTGSVHPQGAFMFLVQLRARPHYLDVLLIATIGERRD